ncbi:MAG: hypothetical protein BroJett040_13710 [Oligoflexia bacterium]|nr:MAG: hypothetical protein BroJett040_13710 [Oligoflexia bacterium]
MDTTKNHQMRVGIFLVGGLIAVLTSILLLGGDKALFKSYVTLYAQLEQVQGLNKGSIVSLSGLVVGNVTEITFSPEKKSLIVALKVDKDFLGRITQGSTAEIRTQGALGDKFIFITPGDPSATPLAANGFLETAKSSDLMGILSEKGGEAAKIFEVVDEVYKLMKTLNSQNRTEKIMNNLTDASHNLKATSEEAQKMMAELRGQNPAQVKLALEKMNSILAKIDKGEGTLGALINDPTVHTQLKTILGGTNRKQTIQSLIRTSIEKSE